MFVQLFFDPSPPPRKSRPFFRFQELYPPYQRVVKHAIFLIKNLSEILRSIAWDGRRREVDDEQRKLLVKVEAERYRRARKKEKGRILDELVALSGYNRPTRWGI
jgi:hypothetical protein